MRPVTHQTHVIGRLDLWGGGAGANQTFASVSGGELDIYDSDFSTGSRPTTFAYFTQSGAGVLQLLDDTFTKAGGGLVGVTIRVTQTTVRCASSATASVIGRRQAEPPRDDAGVDLTWQSLQGHPRRQHA